MKTMLTRCTMLLLALVFLAPPARAADEAARSQLVGWLELRGELIEGQHPLAWLAQIDEGATLSGVLDQLRTVAEGDRYAGVIIYLDMPQLQLTQVQAIGASIQRIRAAGRKVMVFAERYELLDYLLASYADRVLLQHKGELTLNGIAMEELYLAGLLDLIGVRADLEQIGQYKGASEPMTRTGPSEAWSRNIDALLDDMYGQVLDILAENRGVSRDTVEKWMAESWTMTDADLVKAGVVDELTHRDLLSVTEVAFGDAFVWDQDMGHVLPTMQIDSPLAILSLMFQRPSTETKRATIAVIHANGPITSGDSSFGTGFFGEQTIGSRTMVRVLGEARDDDNVKGVVVQMDSPGGSALASEMIWQAVRDTAEHKPVYVSVGPMAASGGYYIAVAGDQIYVHPESIVGSIGVVGGKLALGELYGKVGITTTQRNRGPMAGIYNSAEPFTPQQREIVRGTMQKTYDQFIDRVKVGRGTRLADVGKVAEGRLFTGKAAVLNGMADKVGTLDACVADLAAALNLKAGEYDVLHLPPAMTFEEFIAETFFSRGPSLPGAAAPSMEWQMARKLLGPAAWSGVQRHVTGLLLLRDEAVLTLTPRVLIVK